MDYSIILFIFAACSNKNKNYENRTRYYKNRFWLAGCAVRSLWLFLLRFGHDPRVSCMGHRCHGVEPLSLLLVFLALGIDASARLSRLVQPGSLRRLPVPLHDFLVAQFLLHLLARGFFLLLFPREPHQVLSPELLARVRLKGAEALHPHPLPRTTLQPFLALAPRLVGLIELRGGASAKVIHTHPHAPHRYAQQPLHGGRLLALVRVRT